MIAIIIQAAPSVFQDNAIVLLQNTQEIRITRDSLLEEVSRNLPQPAADTMMNNCTMIPVRRPYGIEPAAFAIINQEDEAMVRQYTWRLSTRGHILTTTNKVTIYLHHLIFGGTSTHRNKNRMDNRRDNLVASKPRGIMVKDSSKLARSDL